MESSQFLFEWWLAVTAREGQGVAILVFGITRGAEAAPSTHFWDHITTENCSGVYLVPL
jgi:hypothetical protein